MKRLKFWLIGLLFCFSLQVQAANWVYVSTDASGNMWSVDTASFRQASNRPNDVWFWTTEVPYEIKNLKTQTYTKTQYHLSCRALTMAALDMIKYDAQGNVIQRMGGYDFNMKAIVPDSIGDAVATYVCTQAFGGKAQ